MRALRQPTILLVLAFGAASPLVAQERTGDAPPEQRTHVVRRGDTLWDLARLYLNNPFQWPRIYEANRSQIRDPHWIYPNQRFVIPPVVPDAVAVKEAAVPEDVRPVALEETTAARRPRRTLFYRGAQPEEPAAPVGREIEIRELEPLPEVQPEVSESAAWLAERRDLGVLGRVVQEVGARGEKDRLLHSMHPLDHVYVAYEDGAPRPSVGEQVLLVAVGRGVGRWGRVIEPTAVATVRELAEDVMIVELTRQFGPVHAGNLAVPLPRFEGAPAARVPVEAGPVGELIDFRTRQPLPAVLDEAFVSLGRADGLEVGDELEVYRPERPSADNSVWLPEEAVAVLRVVRVEEQSATVQVAGLRQPTLERGLPVRLVRKVR